MFCRKGCPVNLVDLAWIFRRGRAQPTVLATASHPKGAMDAFLANVAALYIALRLALRYYFPPDTWPGASSAEDALSAIHTPRVGTGSR